jgi:hypothetical protein
MAFAINETSQDSLEAEVTRAMHKKDADHKWSIGELIFHLPQALAGSMVESILQSLIRAHLVEAVSDQKNVDEWENGQPAHKDVRYRLARPTTQTR